jgi:hypothetical protein
MRPGRLKVLLSLKRSFQYSSIINIDFRKTKNSCCSVCEIYFIEGRMVFAGQDKWRKHPLLSGCANRPLPGLGTAIGLFAGYYFATWTFKRLTTQSEKLRVACPEKLNNSLIFVDVVQHEAPKLKFRFTDSEFGDTVPEVRVLGGKAKAHH